MKPDQIDQRVVEPPISEYLNPDWQKATNHGLASRIGLMTDDNLNFCQCCFHHINKAPISLCQSTKQLQFLGFGLPLYFAFVRYCIFILLFMVCSYNLPSLYFALTHNQQFCSINIDKIKQHPIIQQKTVQLPQIHFHFHRLTSHKKQKQKIVSTQTKSQQEAVHEIECTGWMIYLSRIQKKLTVQQQLIRFGSFFILLMILLYVRDRLTKMKYYFDQRSASPSDFAVYVKNMPPQAGQANILLKVLKKHYNIRDPRQIILLPDLKAYFQMQHQQKMLIKKLQHLVKNEKQPSKQVMTTIHEIRSNQKKLKQLIFQDKKKYFADQIGAERAVISFETQDQKWALINAFILNPLKQTGWQNLLLSQASEPEQIIWENSCYNSKDKKFFRFLGWFLSILTLILITGIFIIISHYKSKLVQQKIIQYQQNPTGDPHLLRQAFFLVLGMIFLVVLFNKFALAHLFHKFTQIEKHSSTYKFQFQFCLKYCLGLFFTTALMTLIIEDFIFHNFFKHNFGVIQEETIMFLFNSTFVPLFWLVNPMYLLKKFKRWRNYGSIYLTQHQANSLMEDPSYDVGKRYGQVVQIMWFTFLYMTIVPIGSIFSCIGLVAYYWVDKYNLLRKSTINGLISGDLIDLTLKMLQFTLPLKAAGEILFDYQLRDGVSMVSWVYLFISVIFILLPSQLLVNIINEQKFFYQKLTYSEAEVLFKNTYKNVNILFNRLDEDRASIIQQKMMKKKSQSFAHQAIVMNKKKSKNKEQCKVINYI